MRSSPVLLGCIADDFTGATDLANMLVRGGMRTVQTIGVPSAPLDTPAQAVVVALKSRTVPRDEAIAESLAALEWLRSLGCRQFYFKYCSTFDSTDEGNIGPVADALMRALGTSFAVACPAFPESGRTVYRGHLFVGDVPLNESGMQNHPLTPMTDANLVRTLQRQTPSKVGLLRYDAIQQGVPALEQAREQLVAQGVRLAIADAISDADLHTLGQACANDLLVTGGSGLAQGLPANFARAGLLDEASVAQQLPAVHGHAAVLAGSCSRATQGQVAHWRERGRPAFRIEPLALAANAQGVVDAALTFARERIESEPVLIYATSAPDEVAQAQQALGTAASGALVEAALASVARGLEEMSVRRFVVAGGETSGSVVNALGVTSLAIGPQIDPGVPWTVSDGARHALALKSGNFGTVDFFEKALAQCDSIMEPAQ